MDYDARFYSPTPGRFTQPDTVVPKPGNTQAWNRYSYVNNNPLLFIDSSGHIGQCPDHGHCRYPSNSSNTDLDLTIVSREEWGAHEPGSYGLQNNPNSEGVYSHDNPNGYQQCDGNLNDTNHTITIHHEGDDATYDVLAIQEAEMNAGFYDIGYHYIIGPDGTIYEGRDIGARGNHAWPNTGIIGILWLGDSNPGYDPSDPLGRTGEDPTDDITGPTDQQFEATAKLISYLDQEYGIDYIYGHREVDPGGHPTTCPGDYAMPAVDLLKKLID